MRKSAAVCPKVAKKLSAAVENNRYVVFFFFWLDGHVHYSLALRWLCLERSNWEMSVVLIHNIIIVLKLAPNAINADSQVRIQARRDTHFATFIRPDEELIEQKKQVVQRVITGSRNIERCTPTNKASVVWIVTGKSVLVPYSLPPNSPRPMQVVQREKKQYPVCNHQFDQCFLRQVSQRVWSVFGLLQELRE